MAGVRDDAGCLGKVRHKHPKILLDGTHDGVEMEEFKMMDHHKITMNLKLGIVVLRMLVVGFCAGGSWTIR